MHFKFLKKILRIIAIILPCFLFTFVFSSPSYAVSDLTTVINSSDMSSFVNQPIFSSCNDSACLSQYHYLTVSVSSNPYTRNSFWVLKGFRGLSNLSVNVDSVNLIDGSTSLVIRSYDNIYNFSADKFTFTLSESLPTVECPDPPSGSLSISQNGTYDVSNYETAVVDVPAEVIQGDYHDDLVSINNTIVLIPAVALVIYFFFAIYRLLIGGF